MVCSKMLLDWGKRKMTYETEAARRYRAHAQELRTIAESDTREQTRKILIKVADDYDQMATSMDAIDETNRLFGKFTPLHVTR